VLLAVLTLLQSGEVVSWPECVGPEYDILLLRFLASNLPTWVEHVFREIFLEKWHFFRGAKCGENGTFFAKQIMAKNCTFRGAKCGKNGPVLGCELGRACFSRYGTFFRGAKCGEKWRFVVGEKWRKWHFFSRSELRRKWRFVVGENGEKWRFPKEI
jgi:hypothetical protein